MKMILKNIGVLFVSASLLATSSNLATASTSNSHSADWLETEQSQRLHIPGDRFYTLEPLKREADPQRVAFALAPVSAACGGACIAAAIAAAARICASKASQCAKALNEAYQKMKKVPKYAKAAKIWARNTQALVKYGRKMKQIKNSAKNNPKLDKGGALGFLVRVGLNEPKDVRGYVGASYLIRNRMMFLAADFINKLNKDNRKAGGISPLKLGMSSFTPHPLISTRYGIRSDYCDASKNTKLKGDLDASCAEVQLFSRAMGHIQQTDFWRDRLTSINNARIAMKHSFFAVFKVASKNKRGPRQRTFTRMTACGNCKPVAKDLGATDIFANPFYSAMFSVIEYIPGL